MAVQRNFAWYRYVDNNSRNWAIRADQDLGDNVAFGLAAFNAADQPFGPQSRRHQPRRVIYQDPTTFRTRVVIVGTAAAVGTAPATLAVNVPGNSTTVTYNLAGNLPEKLQTPKASRNLIDHT
jgi:hypothetical protein